MISKKHAIALEHYIEAYSLRCVIEERYRNGSVKDAKEAKEQKDQIFKSMGGFINSLIDDGVKS